MRRAAPYGITPLVLVVCAVELVVALGRRPSNYQMQTPRMRQEVSCGQPQQ
jgi:hypothetical protein